MSDCESARLKLARAKQHITAYKRAWKRFTGQGNPYGYRGETNDDRTCITLYLEEKRVIPRRLGLIIGDCATNLRAALDHLAFALPRAPGTDDRWERWSQFPIYDSPTQDPVTGRPGYHDAIGRDLCGVDPTVIAACEGLQPYYGGNDPTGHPLRYLRDLVNYDKHRLTHLVALLAEESSIAVPPPPTGWVHGILAIDRLEPEAVIGKVYYSDPAPDPVDVTVSVRFTVTIGSVEPPIGTEYVLKDIHGYIADQVLPALEPFIP